MVSFATRLLGLATLVTLVRGHAALTPEEAIVHKRSSLETRSAFESQCGAALAEQRAARLAKRDEAVHLKRRDLGWEHDLESRNGGPGGPGGSGGGGGNGPPPKDPTCLLTPETTQGPYHILGELVRQNLTETQLGIPLEIQASFVDIKTCKPVQVWVDAWQCNSTGYYSGYVAETGAYMVGNSSQTAPPPNNTKALTPTSGTDQAFAAAFLDNKPVDSNTFLRGVWRTDATGLLTMYTVFPGWYEARAQHFHIKVYEQGHVAKNGTFVAGTAHHTGQFFFDNKTLNAVARTSPYTSNPIPWSQHIPNEQDAWYPYADSSGYTADMDIKWVDPSNIKKGLVGSLVVAINTTFTSPELSTYWYSKGKGSN